MFSSSRVASIASVPSTVASGTQTAAQKLGKVAAAVGLTGKAAVLLRSSTIRRSMLAIPALGLLAIGVIVATKIAKDAKAKKAAERTVPSAYPEGAVGLEPTPELKPYIAEGR